MIRMQRNPISAVLQFLIPSFIVLQENLHTAESVLKEAIGMLVFEHPTTPEGQLTKKAMCELKKLREYIQNVQALAEDEKTDRQFKGKRTTNGKKFVK